MKTIIEKGKIKNKIYYFRLGHLDTIATVWETEKKAIEGKGMSIAILMPNNEIIAKGKTLGFIKEKKYVEIIIENPEKLKKY